MIGETITRLRVDTDSDRYGNDRPDWINAEPDELEIDGCAVAPRESSEDQDAGRQAVIVGLTVYAPTGSDILPADRLLVRGDIYEIDGEFGDWRNPYTGNRPGVTVNLRKVDG